MDYGLKSVEELTCSAKGHDEVKEELISLLREKEVSYMDGINILKAALISLERTAFNTKL